MSDNDTLDLTALPTLEEAGRDHGKVMIHGEPGTGKTTLASSLAELGRVLYLYYPGEQGLASIPNEYRANIVPHMVSSVEEDNDILWQLILGEADKFVGVIKEGIHAWQQLYTRHVRGLPTATARQRDQLKQALKHADMRRIGGDVGGLLKDDITFWYGLADYSREHPLHVVMTSQTRHRQIREKTKDQNDVGELLDEYIGPDVFPGIANSVEATPDYLGYTFIEEGDSLEDDEDYRYCVRFGPHDMIRTKLHSDATSKRQWPSVVGRNGQRLTLPKFFKFHGIIE